MPEEVDRIFKGIKKEHPEYDDSKCWALAYSSYNKSNETLGKEILRVMKVRI